MTLSENACSVGLSPRVIWRYCMTAYRDNGWKPTLRWSILKLPAQSGPSGIDPPRDSPHGQAGFGRIASNILNHAPQVLFVANDPIVAFPLPQRARRLEPHVDLSCRATFPQPADFLQVVFVG